MIPVFEILFGEYATPTKCVAFWRLALNSYIIFRACLKKSILQYVYHNLQNAFSDTLRNKHFSPVIKQPFTYYKTETRYLVQHLLKQEQPAHPHSGSGDPETLNLNQTLYLINYDIVRIVLEQENGNRSRAASRLGISRSTLWRLLRQ